MRLICIEGPSKGKSFAVHEQVTLGRAASNDLVLPDSSVSLVHCQIDFIAGCPWLTDLGSTNGTISNGQRIINCRLQNQDEFSVGRNQFRVEWDPESEPALGNAPSATASSQTIRDDTATPAPAVEAPLGERTGNIFGSVTYSLKRKIADGGMGSIYEAVQFGAEGFVKRVAIKTILPRFARQESFIASFVGEAKLVANLVHQNIVQIHQLDRHEDGYYIAMDYIDGINLTHFLQQHAQRRQVLPLDMATFIVSRVCRGLEYAHTKRDEHQVPLGIVHRDVSPNNIMITHEGEVKLTDFGVAKARQFMEEDEEYLVGNVEYMSPEQASCAPVDARSDLFSLGLVYYELLTGIRVFQCKTDNLEESLECVRTAEIPDPMQYRPDLKPNLRNILLKCLQKDPDKRYGSAGELSLALEQDMYSKGYGPTIVALAKYTETLGIKPQGDDNRNPS